MPTCAGQQVGLNSGPRNKDRASARMIADKRAGSVYGFTGGAAPNFLMFRRFRARFALQDAHRVYPCSRKQQAGVQGRPSAGRAFRRNESSSKWTRRAIIRSSLGPLAPFIALRGTAEHASVTLCLCHRDTHAHAGEMGAEIAVGKLFAENLGHSCGLGSSKPSSAKIVD